jgi:DNA polymerase-3 subunit alpha
MSAHDFVHLHVHSDGSLLDGGNTIDSLVRRAQELEMRSLAITDHGVMYSAWEFQEKARKAGLNPIIGMEAYVAPGARGDRQTRSANGKWYYHLVLLAMNRQGYHNLSKLSSIGFKEGYYYTPRLDREVLARHNEGLIVSSACLAGEIAQNIEIGRWDAAREAAEWYANVFQDRFFLEVQGHDSEGQAALNRGIFRLSEETGIPVIATNDAHFLSAGDHKAHDCLICIGMKKDRDDASRLIYDRGLYFKSGQEMAERFADRPDVLTRTAEIADRVSIQFEKKYYVPSFPIAAEKRDELRAHIEDAGGVSAVLPAKLQADPDLDEAGREQAALEIQLIRELAYEGARKRYGQELSQEIVDRLEYEFDVICGAGYSGYHLITADFIGWAREHGIPVGPGRGSAAGSLVCYALGITDVDPLPFDLLFERFLNPERVSMPDIDVDFCYERRGEVIDYVREKYGHDAVAQIVTYGTLKARAVVKDVGRVLGFSPSDTNRLASLIPNDPNNSLTVGEAIERVPEIVTLYNNDPRYREWLDLAKSLEGLRRHAGVHAAGVVIAPGPVDNYVPTSIQWGKGSGASEEGSLVTQYDMNCLERAGMLKMDFLGLKTLTVITDALRMIQERGKGALDLDRIPLDDEKTYRDLVAGRTAGVFQMESALATDKLGAMKADCFDDLIAANALLRPGPLETGMTDRYIKRKLGNEKVEYPHPLLEETLKPTLGIIVYQEQIMRAAQILAGHTLGEADMLRKAVGKKDAKLIEQELNKFVERAVSKGTCTESQAREIAALIETFGRYGFNKSHSTAYAVLAYQTAYLKSHHPAEFMAGLLSSVADKTDDVVKYLAECREMGIQVLSPHVNESDIKFNVVTGEAGKDAIRFGLGAIKGVGEGVIQAVLAARREAPFRDLFDFVTRSASPQMNRRVLDALILGGALDGLGPNRAAMLDISESVLKATAQDRKDEQVGQFGLFGMGEEEAAPVAMMPKYRDVPEFADLLDREREVLGLYVSGHPLDSLGELARALSTHNSLEMREYREGKMRIAGVVTQKNERISKKDGRRWAEMVISDLSGTIRANCFADNYAKYQDILVDGAIVLVEGSFPRDAAGSDQAPTLFLDHAQFLDVALAAGEVAVHVQISDAERRNEALMTGIREALQASPGQAPVMLQVDAADGTPGAPRAAQTKVRPTPALLATLREMLDPRRVSLQRQEVDRTNWGYGRGRTNGPRWEEDAAPVPAYSASPHSSERRASSARPQGRGVR